jgi:hypothetical protein
MKFDRRYATAFEQVTKIVKGGVKYRIALAVYGSR